jgi:hypothetical protein
MSPRDRRIALAAILLAGGLLRGLVWLTYAETPLPVFHHWTESDMSAYHEWAQAVAAGDWLTREPRIPYHVWHAELATLTLGRPVSEEEGRAFWRERLGANRFYQDPLYPYFLAVVQRATGSSTTAVFLLQNVLGLASVLLVYRITRRVFDDPPVATAAAALAAAFGPAIYFEFFLLRCTLLIFFGLLAVWMTLRLFDRPTRLRAAGVGVVLGLAFLLKSTGAGLLAVVGALLVYALRGQGRRVVVTAAAGVLAGFVAVLVPLVARNLSVGAPPLSLASSGKASFVRHGVYAPPGERRPRPAAAILERLHREGGSPILATLRSYPSVWALARHFGGNLLGFWSWYERPDNGNYYYYRLLTPATSAVRVEFWMIAALAVPGFVLARSASPRHLLLVACALFGVATIVAFFNVSRFRVPVVFFMIPYAAWTLVSLARKVSLGEYRRAAPIAAAVAVVGGLVLAGPASSPPIRWLDYASGNELMVHVARQHADGGSPERAAALLERHLRSEPPALRALAPAEGTTSRIDRRLLPCVRSFARTHAAVAGFYGDANVERREYHRRRAGVLATVARQYEQERP